MKPRFFFLTVSLITFLAVSACAPAVAGTPATLPTASIPATSRGPNLEATDPTTVALASGQLQLVEFFRFT